MIFRHDTHSFTTLLASSRSEADTIGVGGTATWQRMDRDTAFSLFATFPDRGEALRTLRALFGIEFGARISRLDDNEVLRFAAERFGNGWYCVRTRIPSGGGWSGEDAQKIDYVTEAIEPEERPTGIPQKKEKDHWIIVELLGENGEPIPNELCRITLPDGQVIERETNSQGRVEEYMIVDGDCTIEFPDLDKDAWEPYQGALNSGAAA